jgi:hypothetical protein
MQRRSSNSNPSSPRSISLNNSGAKDSLTHQSGVQEPTQGLKKLKVQDSYECQVIQRLTNLKIGDKSPDDSHMANSSRSFDSSISANPGDESYLSSRSILESNSSLEASFLSFQELEELQRESLSRSSGEKNFLSRGGNDYCDTDIGTTRGVEDGNLSISLDFSEAYPRSPMNTTISEVGPGRIPLADLTPVFLHSEVIPNSSPREQQNRLSPRPILTVSPSSYFSAPSPRYANSNIATSTSPRTLNTSSSSPRTQTQARTTPSISVQFGFSVLR